MTLQMALDLTGSLKTEWVPPVDLPDIFDAKQIAIDLETRDPNLKSLGPYDRDWETTQFLSYLLNLTPFVMSCLHLL